MKRLRLHVESIAATHNIEIRHWTRDYCECVRNPARINIWPVQSHDQYAAALHELGHHLGRQQGHPVTQELQAWEWAEENALVWTRAMRLYAIQCMCSHYCHWVKMYCPPPPRSRAAKLLSKII